MCPTNVSLYPLNQQVILCIFLVRFSFVFAMRSFGLSQALTFGLLSHFPRH